MTYFIFTVQRATELMTRRLENDALYLASTAQGSTSSDQGTKPKTSRLEYYATYLIFTVQGTAR